MESLKIPVKASDLMRSGLKMYLKGDQHVVIESCVSLMKSDRQCPVHTCTTVCSILGDVQPCWKPNPELNKKKKNFPSASHLL